MPTSPVVAMTLPFGEASATLSFFDPTQHDEGAAASSVLPIRDHSVAADGPLDHLLDEAIELSHAIGAVVRRRWLAGSGGGSYWRRGTLRIVLDRESTKETQLATIAEALRGHWGLESVPMSLALAEFLDVRSAA